MEKNSKKKIIIVNSNLNIGGVQKALINLLKCVSDKYDITLALFNASGDLLKEIPDDVKILPIKSDYRFLGLSKYDVENNFFLKLKRNLYASITKMFGRDIAISLMGIRQKKLSRYDVAISYIHNGSDKAFYGGCNDFVLRHIDANEKITFLHCDFELCGSDTRKNREKYKKFDVIAACSEGCRIKFVNKIPELECKTKVVYNCQDYDLIKKKADELEVDFAKNKINIVTIARLGKEKGVSRAIEAIANSNLDKEKYHYYIIGDGIEKDIIKEKIKKYDLNNNITLLGELINPYPYLKAADLLLIPSYSEAAPMVIGEASYLGVPVLSTETSSTKEMIVDTESGWVCENSIEGLGETLEILVNNKNQLLDMKNSLEKIDYNNNFPIMQFKDLLEN